MIVGDCLRVPSGSFGQRADYCLVGIVYCFVLLYFIGLYCIVLHYIVLHHIVLYCIILCCIALYCIVLHGIVSALELVKYCTVL